MHFNHAGISISQGGMSLIFPIANLISSQNQSMQGFEAQLQNNRP